MGCHGTHRRVTGMPVGGAHRGEARWASRGAGEYSRNQLASSFPAREHFLPQAAAPARAPAWFVPAAAPLAATEHWLGGVAPTGQTAPSLAAINRLKLCKCCKSSALACGNRAQKLLTH